MCRLRRSAVPDLNPLLLAALPPRLNESPSGATDSSPRQARQPARCGQRLSSSNFASAALGKNIQINISLSPSEGERAGARGPFARAVRPGSLPILTRFFIISPPILPHLVGQLLSNRKSTGPPGKIFPYLILIEIIILPPHLPPRCRNPMHSERPACAPARHSAFIISPLPCLLLDSDAISFIQVTHYATCGVLSSD